MNSFLRSIMIILIFVALSLVISQTKIKPQTLAPAPSPTPKILKPIDHYEPPQIAPASSYTLIFVGDSMTEGLGENFDDLSRELKKFYPDKVFGNFNYGFGSTNILSLEDRLNQGSVYQGKTFPAILSRYFDIIIIESFGHNPLSQYPLDQGLMVQTNALDHLVAELVDAKPNSLIVFLATLAPSQSHYGQGVVDLSPEARSLWADERRAYIENHINYAKRHNIPLINVYEKSLDENGQAILKYIDSGNYIHPSAAGIALISQEIANFLNGVLPH